MNGDALTLAEVVAKEHVTTPAGVVAIVAVEMAAKGIVGALALVLVESHVLMDAKAVVGACLANAKDVGGVNPVIGTNLLYTISLQITNTINKCYMKRISFIITLQVFFSISVYAQLSKFEGTWVSKDVQMRVDIKSDNERRESPMADRWSFFRFDVKDNNIFIRHKMYFKHYDSGAESTHYFTIKDIEVKGDSVVCCDIYSPPEMGKCYDLSINMTPRNRRFDRLVEHNKTKFKIVNGLMVAEWGPTLQDFFLNGQLVDTDCYPNASYVYRKEYYNEKDNW